MLLRFKLANAKIIRRFTREENGNIAMIFALALLPTFAMVGLAIDYSRATSARSAMQAAVDATALMISKDVGSLNASQINTKANAYFTALFKHPEVTGVTLTAAYTPNTGTGSTILVSGAGNLPTDIMKNFGYSSVSFNATSTVTWGSTKLRVALVLDNTYSMTDSGKMPALKSAAKDLVDTLSTAAKSPGDVYISIVPFNEDVNVGVSNINQPWLDWSYWDATEGTCSQSSHANPKSCQSNGKTWNTHHDKWTGCVRDRTTITNLDTVATAPTSANSLTLFQPVREDFYYGNFGDPCPQQITPLSYDWSTLKSKIDAMVPNGTTNQAIGLAWGWMTLLQQTPFNAPAEDPNYVYSKVLILLSDGDNTANRSYPWDGTGGYPSQTTINAIDARQKLLCDNAKAAGIKIYTIQVNTDGTANSSVMSYCASSSANYFSTTSSSGIASAFSSIGTSLSKLRIAK